MICRRVDTIRNVYGPSYQHQVRARDCQPVGKEAPITKLPGWVWIVVVYAVLITLNPTRLGDLLVVVSREAARQVEQNYITQQACPTLRDFQVRH